MCHYISHIRVCDSCAIQDTVLISECPCHPARTSGVFGSCGSGIENTHRLSVQECWQCRERNARLIRTRPLRRVGNIRVPPMNHA